MTFGHGSLELLAVVIEHFLSTTRSSLARTESYPTELGSVRMHFSHEHVFLGFNTSYQIRGVTYMFFLPTKIILKKLKADRYEGYKFNEPRPIAFLLINFLSSHTQNKIILLNFISSKRQKKEKINVFHLVHFFMFSKLRKIILLNTMQYIVFLLMFI